MNIDKLKSVAKEKVKNCTPHSVTILVGSMLDPSSNNRIGGTELMSFEPCGNVAVVTSALSGVSALDVDGCKVPYGAQTTASLSKLPADAEYWIVSNIYAQAAKEMGLDTSHLLIPYEKVKQNGRVVGCTGFVTI